MQKKVLIAGIGNIFLGDDGFGVAVAKRLMGMTLPPWVTVVDFGIRGIHLAYEMLEGRYASAILIDAVRRGGRPGTVYVIEPDIGEIEANGGSDAHGMDPATVLAMLKTLGGTPGKIYIVGCEPACVDEVVGLSREATHAIDDATELILKILWCSDAAAGARDG